MQPTPIPVRYAAPVFKNPAWLDTNQNSQPTGVQSGAIMHPSAVDGGPSLLDMSLGELGKKRETLRH